MASSKNEEQQIKAADRCHTQEDFIVKRHVVVAVIGVGHRVQVIEPEELVGEEAGKDDADEKQVFHLGPELLVGE